MASIMINGYKIKIDWYDAFVDTVLLLWGVGMEKCVKHLEISFFPSNS